MEVDRLEAKEDERSIGFYLKQKAVRVNLLVMAYMWANCSFSYYMIVYYLKYLPGNIYNNSFASGCSDLIAIVLAGVLYSRYGLRNSFTFLLALSVLGGTLIICLGTPFE